jgi:streptogramin lyase
MTPSTKPVLTALLLSSLALGACGNLTDGKGQTPTGVLTLLSSSPTGPALSDGTAQRTPVTGTGSIGTVTLVTFSVQLSVAVDAVAIASDGSAWFTNYGNLVRVGTDDTVWIMPMAPGAGYAPALVSDGVSAVWMANWDPIQGIGRLDPSTGNMQLFDVPSPLSRPAAVASDGKGGIWMSGGDQPIVGRVDSTNHVFVLASETAPPPITVSTLGLAIASDGTVFVSDYDQGRIGRVQRTGFLWTDVGGSDAAPSGLAAGDNGSVWFVSLGATNEVGRVDADGTLHAYPLPAATTTISDKSASTIARAPDGAFWFTLPDREQLGRVTADGQLSFIQLATNSLPRGLAFDQKGRLWFTSVPGFGRIEF